MRVRLPVNVVAFTVSGHRQKYLRATLDSWAAARGVQDWHLLFALEPCRLFFPVPEFTAWVRGAFASAQVSVADSRLGCLRNTRRALREAFASGAGFAVLAEEDIVVSTDVLEYFRWAAGTYAGEGKVTAVCAHSLHAGSGDQAAVVQASWFSPIVWGTWADRWREFIGPGWHASPGNSQSWDDHLRRRINGAGRCSIFPVRSRSQHRGQTSTLTPGPLAEWFYRQALSGTFTAARPPQSYREVPFTEDLGLIV